MFISIDYSSMISQLYNLVITLLTWAGSAWEWLNTPLFVGWGVTSIAFTPLALFGGQVLFTMMGLYFIKTFVPMA